MKAYKIEMLVIDYDKLGAEGITDVIEKIKYPNWCIAPNVKHVECAEIGEWDDDHPLNSFEKEDEYYKNIFREEKN